MNNTYDMYQLPYSYNTPIYNTHNISQCPYFANAQVFNPYLWNQIPNQYFPCINQAKPSAPIILKDYGSKPFVVNIEEATKQNNNFRLALWTGKHLQLTLMSIKPGEEIGLEIHPNLDQFIRIEEGQGHVEMGDRKEKLDFHADVYDDFAFIIPAGKWHNLTNTGNSPLKLYSIYAPPQHPFGTVHKTKADEE